MIEQTEMPPAVDASGKLARIPPANLCSDKMFLGLPVKAGLSTQYETMAQHWPVRS
jgi:hypothetical protein